MRLSPDEAKGGLGGGDLACVVYHGSTIVAGTGYKQQDAYILRILNTFARFL